VRCSRSKAGTAPATVSEVFERFDATVLYAWEGIVRGAIASAPPRESGDRPDSLVLATRGGRGSDRVPTSLRLPAFRSLSNRMAAGLFIDAARGRAAGEPDTC
jgi:hypothetical protein